MIRHRQKLAKSQVLSMMLMLLSIAGIAQGQDLKSKGDSLFRAALGEIGAGNFNDARNLLQEAEVAFAKTSSEQYFRVKKAYARIFYLEGFFSKMSEELESGLQECLRSYSDSSFEYALLIHEKGIYHMGKAQLDSAAHYIRLALSAIRKSREETDKEYIRYLNDLGVVFYRQNKFPKAIEYYQRARDIQLNTRGKYDGIIANADLNIGQVYQHWGDYEQAIKLYDQALEFYSESDRPNNPGIGQLYLSLGDCYSLKSFFQKAVTYQKKAIEVWSDLYGPDHVKVGYAYRKLAYTYNQNEEFIEAKENIDKAVAILANLPERNELEYMHAQVTKAIIEMDQGDYEGATRTNQDLIDEYEGSELEHQLTNVFHNQAIVYNLLQEGKKSEEYSEKSLVLNDRNEKSPWLYEKTYQNLIVSKTIQREFNEADRLVAKALSYRGANTFGDLRLANGEVNSLYHVVKSALENTLEAYRRTGEEKWLHKGSTYIDQLDSSLGVQTVQLLQSEKAEILHKQHEINGLMLAILSARYQATGNINFLERFIQIQDKGKSNLILSNILKNETYASSGVPDSLTKLEKRLTLDIALAKHLDSLNTSITLYEQLDSVQNEIQLYRRNYEELTTKTLDIDELQSALLAHEALIQFSVVDSLIYTSIVTQEALRLVQLEADFLDPLLQQLNAIKKKSKQADFTFYDQIEPILEALPEKVTELHFVRDGMLNLVPLEIIKDHGGNYLFEQYAVSSQLSFNHYLRARNRQVGYGRILAINPTFSGDRLLASNYHEIVRGTLDPLKGAADEIGRLVNDFDALGLSGKFATETSLRNQINDFNYLHFATHAIIDDANPEYSKLVLSPDSLSDGYLHAYELHSMQISSELVTLSACNTGFGQIKAGEGAMSLAHAFAYAGAPNILMSLWPVNDQSTAELIQYFYENLNSGMRKNEALRQAKLAYLSSADPVKSHPYYWAGFVISGSPDPINFGKSSYLVWYWITGFFILLLGVVYFRLFRSA